MDSSKFARVMARSPSGGAGAVESLLREEGDKALTPACHRRSDACFEAVRALCSGRKVRVAQLRTFLPEPPPDGDRAMTRANFQESIVPNLLLFEF